MSKNVAMKDQNNLTSPEDDSRQKVTSISVSFFVSAILTNFYVAVLLSGAQDILAGTEIPTSTVLMASLVPNVLVVCVLPYFANRIPYAIRFMFASLCMATAFLILGLTHYVSWKMLGVTLESLANGVGDLSVVSLASYFDRSALAAYSSGTAVGLLVGPLYYTAMTTWFCVSPNITLLTVAPTSLLYLVCYYIIQKEITKDETKGPATKEEIAYSKIQTSDDEDTDKEMTKRKETQEKVQKFTCRETLTWKEKLLAVKKLLVFVAIPVFIAFLSEYTLFQSVVTTVAFTNAPFPPRDHYQYYSIALMLGEVLGRSHRSLIGVINAKWLYTPTLKGLWALSIIEVVHLFFFLFESWYRFLPNVGIVILLCFTAGINIGGLFCYLFEFVRVKFQENEHEFIFGLVLFFINSGGLSASLLGLYVETRLREHCIATVKDTSYCFTRVTKSKDIVAACKAGMIKD